MDPALLQLILTGVSPAVNFLGSGTLVYLFGTNRILTRGQHQTRVDDLKADFEAQLAEKDRHHAEIIAFKDTRMGELKEDLKTAAQLATDERSRADAATTQLSALSREVAKLAGTAFTPTKAGT